MNDFIGLNNPKEENTDAPAISNDDFCTDISELLKYSKSTKKKTNKKLKKAKETNEKANKKIIKRMKATEKNCQFLKKEVKTLDTKTNKNSEDIKDLSCRLKRTEDGYYQIVSSNKNYIRNKIVNCDDAEERKRLLKDYDLRLKNDEL